MDRPTNRKKTNDMKKKVYTKKVLKLERHLCAPELNTLHFTDGTSVLAPQCQNIEQAMKHVPTEASERRDRIDMLVNKVVDMKYDLQEVLDELYRMQHENEEE